jgi:hypothetical protein
VSMMKSKIEGIGCLIVQADILNILIT